jgi:ribosomal protein S6--L-glutamate ligase
MKIGLITVEPDNYVAVELKKAAEKLGYDFDIVNCNHLACEVDGKVIYSPEDGEPKELDKYDVVIPRLSDENLTQKFYVMKAIERNYSRWVNNTADAMRACQDKLATYDFVRKVCEKFENVRIPKTVVAVSALALPAARELLGDKIVAKTLNGSQGDGVMLIDSERGANSIISYLIENANIMLQECIEHDVGYRIITLGNQLFASNKKERVEHEFRTNAAKGAKSSPHEPSEREVKVCTDIAAEMFESSFVAVDYLLVGDEMIILEVNGSPGLEDMQKSYPDRNLCEDFLKYCGSKVGGDQANVEEPPMNDDAPKDEFTEPPKDVEVISTAPAPEPEENEQNEPTEVATEETVRIPVIHDGDIKAKVDTGADLCSLHAENIEVNEKMNLVMFTVHDRRFQAWYERLAEIKNANETKFRPIIKLTVHVGDKPYENVEVSLTDRSSMEYEFLIGKNLLEQMNASVKVEPSDKKEEE